VSWEHWASLAHLEEDSFPSKPSKARIFSAFIASKIAVIRRQLGQSYPPSPDQFTLLFWESFSLTLRGVSVWQDHPLLTLPFLPSSNVLVGPHVFGHH
jgi:hypothetical protein